MDLVGSYLRIRYKRKNPTGSFMYEDDTWVKILTVNDRAGLFEELLRSRSIDFLEDSPTIEGPALPGSSVEAAPAQTSGLVDFRFIALPVADERLEQGRAA